MATKTWDVSRTGGGTYEFSQDPQGRYTLRSVGFKGISKLNLPELKTGAAATTAVDTPKDVAALSAQTTEAFGDVTPFYYDKDEDEASKYIRRKEDKDRDDAVTPITYAEARKRMTQDEAYTRPEYSTTRPFGIDTPMKKPLPKWTEDVDTRGWSTEAMTAKPKEVTQVGRITKPEILKEKAAAAQKIKKVKPLARQPTPEERFASTYVSGLKTAKTPRPFIGGGLDYDTQYTTGKEFDVAPSTGLQRGIAKTIQTAKGALDKINTGTTFLRTAAGIVGGPLVSGAAMLMGAVKETPLNKLDKQYFNADNAGRIVTVNPTTGKQENASTSLYAGMNRVSLRGNVEKAGDKRIATRRATITRKGYKAGDKFYDDTKNMEKEAITYKKEKTVVMKNVPPSQRGNGGSRDNCFLPDTPVTMLDGNTKLIKDIDIGDNVAKGGKVFAVGKLLTNDLYDYKGIKVSGSHMVNENGKWMRIRDSQYGKALGNDEHIVYAFGAEDRRILIKGILFTDYFEVREQDKLIEEGNKYFENWKDYDNIFIKLEENHNVAVLNKN